MKIGLYLQDFVAESGWSKQGVESLLYFETSARKFITFYKLAESGAKCRDCKKFKGFKNDRRAMVENRFLEDPAQNHHPNCKRISIDEKMKEQMMNKLRKEIMHMKDQGIDYVFEYWLGRVGTAARSYTEEQKRLLKYNLIKLLKKADEEEENGVDEEEENGVDVEENGADKEEENGVVVEENRADEEEVNEEEYGDEPHDDIYMIEQDFDNEGYEANQEDGPQPNEEVLQQQQNNQFVARYGSAEPEALPSLSASSVYDQDNWMDGYWPDHPPPPWIL